MRFSPVTAAVRATALATFAVAGLALAAPAQAAPTMPVTAGAVARDANLLTNVEWGPPHGNAYGYRRNHGWRGQGGPGYAYGYGRPQGFYGPRVQSCRTTYVRHWNEWRGGWTTRPVRRCW
jgi:hypothetical protein